MSESTSSCAQCGAPLSAHPPEGLCPACLLQRGLGSLSGEAETSAFTPPEPAELAPLFPALEILELIGRGGMGAVYRARQRELDRTVALKILPPGIGADPAFAERFTREARALAKLNHPNIVTLYEFGVATTPPSSIHPSLAPSPTNVSASSQPLYYFLMEYVDGMNLRHLLQRGRVSPREALAIVPEICDALQFAHDHGLVHRDIKPENILLDRRGRVKVADFGLAKLIAGESEPSSNSPAFTGHFELTEAGKILGTPRYMAPEQTTQPASVDHRADIYALGVVFYQMLTGELPGTSTPLEPPSRKFRLDVRLDEIVLRALEQNPERRYAQASQFKTQVENLAADTPAATVESALPSLAQSPFVCSRLFSWAFGEDRDGRFTLRWPRIIMFYLGGTAFTLLFGTVLAFVIQQHSLSTSNALFWALVCPLWATISLILSSRKIARLKGALPAMESWLALADAGDYARHWETADPSFHRVMPREEWIARLEKIRRPLGSVSRRQLHAQTQSTATRLTVTYRTAFAGLPAATETVSFARDEAGPWRALGYLIKPADPQKAPAPYGPISDAQNAANLAAWSDPAHWTGPLYFCKRDPRTWVPKRTGLGWTLNFGRPAALWTIGLIVLAALIISPLSVGYFAQKKARPTVSTKPASAEPPQLRYLAWLDEVQKNPHWQAWRADGELVKPEELHLPPTLATPTEMDVSQTKAAAQNPRFLCLWISHPAFDAQSVVEIKLLDRAGQPLETPTHDFATGVAPPTRDAQNLGWVTASICAGSMGKIPPMANVRLNYSAGPWQYWDDLAVDFHGSRALSNGVLVTDPGQGTDGKAFIQLTRDRTQDPGNEQFDFVAVTKDGHRLDRIGHSDSGSGSIKTERCIFDAPLSQVEKFQCRKRPINTISWTISLQQPPPVNPPATITSAQATAFGPVMEWVLERRGPKGGYDLDTGEFKAFKEAGGPPEPQMAPRWRQESGVDLMVDPDSYRPSVLFSGTLLAHVEEAVWSATATTVAKDGRIPPAPPAGSFDDRMTFLPAPDGSGKPDTLLVRTQQGGCGVLQILGATDQRGVKLRYKLVQNVPEVSLSPSGASAFLPISQEAIRLWIEYQNNKPPLVFPDSISRQAWMQEQSVYLQKLIDLTAGTAVAPLLARQFLKSSELQQAQEADDKAKFARLSNEVTMGAAEIEQVFEKAAAAFPALVTPTRTPAAESENHLLDLELAANAALERYKPAHPEVIRLRGELAAFEKQHPDLRGPQYLDAIIQRQSELSAEREKLALQYSPAHPTVRRVDAELKILAKLKVNELLTPLTLQDQIVINLESSGMVIVQGHELSLTELLPRLKTCATLQPPPAIILRSKPQVEYARVVQILDVCREVGLVNIAFATASTPRSTTTPLH